TPLTSLGTRVCRCPPVPPPYDSSSSDYRFSLFFVTKPPPPGSTLFPYTTLFRSVKAGDTILLHAAAGGVGLILSQWAKHLGATVIGTVSNDEKAKLAKAHGCDHVIIYTREDFVKRVDEITGGKKVAVVYDSVGKDTFLKSLDCLAPLGVVALFGQSSGGVDPLNLGLLAQKGSLYVTRPTLVTYAAKREN